MNLSTRFPQSSMIALTSDTIYQGSVREGIPNGRGVIWDARSHSIVYEGEFQDGLYNGQGTEYSNQKVFRKGLFERGVLTKGKMVSRNGCVLDGTIRQGQLNGRGRLTLPSGAYIEGLWKEGKPYGVCTVFIAKRKWHGLIQTNYDFDNPDDNTKFTVKLSGDGILYEDKYLVEHSQPIILCYFNGDVFVGNTASSSYPSRGYYFYRTENKFERTVIEGGLKTLQVELSCPSSDVSSGIVMDLIE